ncbi:MAG: DnaB-like helicase C-terminal domain-containing protein [Armatimonadota bacterium]|nr:DnaB-like helicase C-terminal domain-containing protein [Armatimonadota bacterium]MDR5675734.1 DnaB-like helicase C-terminal domain-containing protein [Armatimonadota bacterium]MDR5688560.1 DnaB-like helicase C-terminal domain-containing protein [Armatimonadota bacterium]MDR7386396.1 DnaB-like helicase C-terminal domain-containing protein [Armatimonadota bacterium]MDR7389001.1 DnaB-like helicase C-terminal domain-containing protein [Armatimonadota bacterium]
MDARYELDVAVVAGLMADRHLISLALNEGFAPEMLDNPVAQRLSKVVLELAMARAAPLDQVSVRHEVHERGLLTPEMERLLQAVRMTRPPSASQMASYLDALKARESRRRLEAVQRRIQDFLRQGERAGSRDLVRFVGEVVGELFEVQKRRLRQRLVPVGDLVAELIENVQNPSAGGLLGYSISPFDRLNRVLSGLRPGFYYGLAGAPRRGKTNLALQLASYVARNHRIPVLFYSWEQTAKVLAARLLAKEMLVSPADILAGTVDRSPLSLSKLRAAEEEVYRFAPYLYLVEAGRRDTLDRIKAHAYNVMQEHDTDRILVCLDYLQKIPLDEPIADDKARTDLISSQLAELSLELRAPILAISPLDKEGCRLDERPAEDDGESELYERPTMHHSVGSGDLEYDLDVAMVLVKDWKATRDLRDYLESKARQEGLDPEELPRIDILNLFIDKNRDAPEAESNIVQFAFFITLNKFVELGYKHEKEYRGDFRGFSKVVEIYSQLKEAGLLHAPPEALVAGS